MFAIYIYSNVETWRIKLVNCEQTYRTSILIYHFESSAWRNNSCICAAANAACIIDTFCFFVGYFNTAINSISPITFKLLLKHEGM